VRVVHKAFGRKPDLNTYFYNGSLAIPEAAIVMKKARYDVNLSHKTSR